MVILPLCQHYSKQKRVYSFTDRSYQTTANLGVEKVVRFKRSKSLLGMCSKTLVKGPFDRAKLQRLCNLTQLGKRNMNPLGKS